MPRFQLAHRGSSSRSRGPMSRMMSRLEAIAEPGVEVEGAASGVTSIVCRWPSRTMPSLTLLPSGVS